MAVASIPSSGERWRWTQPAVITLVAFTGINLFNYMDRFVLSALLTQIGKAPENGGLGLDKAQQGQLYSAFIIVYALTSPIFGVVGDRVRRMWIVAGAVALWSCATGASGLMHSMTALMIARACTGVGEAAYASITPSIISDVVPKSARGRALAIFNSAIPVGSALGFMVGGYVAERYGWRHAFIAAGVPGLALAVWCLFIREPKRGGMDAGGTTERARLVDALRRMARAKYALPVLGYILQTAGFGALAYWAPSYLEQSKGMDPAKATFYFGMVVVITGIAGTMAGGWLGDWWLHRNSRGLMLVCALSSLLAVPCIVVMLYATTDLMMWSSIATGCFLMVMSVGPVNAQIVNVLNANERATGIAMSTTLIHLLGDVPSVPLIGGMVDSMSGVVAKAEGDSWLRVPFYRDFLESLPHNMSLGEAWTRALLVVPVCIALGALVWLASAFVKDSRKS